MKKIPNAFQQLCTKFHQDIFEVRANTDELIATLLDGLSRDQSAAIKKFLGELLSGAYSTAEIKGVWNRHLDEVGFTRAREAYDFTLRLRDAMA